MVNSGFRSPGVVLDYAAPGRWKPGRWHGTAREMENGKWKMVKSGDTGDFSIFHLPFSIAAAFSFLPPH